MAEDKKTQMGTGTMNAQPPPAGAGGTPAPASRSAPPLATEMLDPNTPFAQVGTPPPQSRPPTTPAPSTAHYAVQPNPQDALIGQTLADRYYVQKKLGEGGMGAVYLATHKVLEKQVALKVLHGEFARKQDLVERFMQEAKAASRIRHENVIDVSDFGSTPDGQVFFAMELLKGHDLHEEIARARIASQLLPWARTKRIFLQICSALSAAHGLGIVHRDLKPENVFLVEFLGDTDFVKLLDFGIAKLTEVNEEGRKLTRTGMLFGTPEYMSPEQARGDTADHRVDIYAMGCILFQLITTRVPFEADNFMGVLSLHLTEPPPQISDATFDAVGAPRELMQIIDRALAKDRNERFQTMDELANAVRVASGDAPVGPRGATTEQTAQRASAVINAPAATTTQRPRTQWTGALKVPEEPGELPARAQGSQGSEGSKMPLVIGAAVLVAGGAIAAAVLLSGGKSTPPATPPPGVASGSPAVAVVPPPPAAVDAGVTGPALPADVLVTIDSKPSAAEIHDVSGKMVGVTPWKHHYAGDRNGLQFVVHLHGYNDSVVNADLDKPEAKASVVLVRGSEIAHLQPLPPAGRGSAAAALLPDAGVAGPVTEPAPLTPDAAVAVAPTPAPDAAPAVQVQVKVVPCMPDPISGGCLKAFDGSGSASP